MPPNYKFTEHKCQGERLKLWLNNFSAFRHLGKDRFYLFKTGLLSMYQNIWKLLFNLLSDI